jgi:hypothetical protein
MIESIFLNIFKTELNKTNVFYNKHYGESCYLFGDGVSLKYFDLKYFKDKKSIIGGFLPFHKDFDVLDSPYLTLIEPYYFFPFIRNTENKKDILINKIQLRYRRLFSQYPDKYFFLNLSNLPITFSKNIYYLYKKIHDDRIGDDFISNHINCFEGTLRAQILMAIYMGFSHVYLVGHDYTHYPSRSLHFYENGEGLEHDLRLWNQDFFEYAKRFISITTITLDGGSETLQSVNYKDYTGADPVFKENNEIVSPEMLSILSTWPGYRI